jgi:hypothetical protein
MPEFACEILTPYRRFYSGKAESITFVTHDGQIEILAMHESLVAPVRIGQLRLVIGGKVRKAAVTEGFARVKEGKGRPLRGRRGMARGDRPRARREGPGARHQAHRLRDSRLAHRGFQAGRRPRAEQDRRSERRALRPQLRLTKLDKTRKAAVTEKSRGWPLLISGLCAVRLQPLGFVASSPNLG